MTAQGILYGVGVGPGDPKLMTIRAGEVIRAADVLAYLVNGSGTSRARSIAAALIPKGAHELPLHVPMREEREPARAAYDIAATSISNHLGAGRSVAYLCVGDPLFYGSFMYLAARLSGAHKIEVVPGVTSLSACAARTLVPLGGRTDVLSVVPATLGEDALKSALADADAASIIKVGRHFAKVRGVLRALGLESRATLLESVTGKEERISAVEDLAENGAGEEGAPYFSTILVRRRELS
ncbi:MAG TPA: precorrin-2 C(20)-methyltransferase [Rhizobiales bacterium]|nr:precorrin-2 C(20)-methyltransferase [bacterium BMS3Bbin10]HDO51173.1 precorrin-2 C(20)-methyltransferase [Hyphomicrobiales bacterium]